MTDARVHLREAQNEDTPALQSFLAQHAETSMFLRGNLAAHGLGNTSHRHGTTYWIWGTPHIKGVIGCSNGGYLMCQAPNAPSGFWMAAADMLQGRSVNGITGAPAQVEAWIAALGLATGAFSLRKNEPLYRLSLDQLIPSVAPDVHLREPVQLDLPLLADWFEGYATDTGIAPMGGASGVASAQMFAVHSAARVLVREETPVAMTSLNAELDEIVQVGGVYVPPALRGQGLGGAVVAAQLTELRGKGVQTAVLFAASAAAARAYERIGFAHIGSYEICLLKSAFTVERTGHVLQT